MSGKNEAERQLFETLIVALRKNPHSRVVVQTVLDASVDLLKAGKDEAALRTLDLLFRFGGNTPQFEKTSAYRKWVAAWLKAKELAGDATQNPLSYPLARQAVDGLLPIPNGLEEVVRERVDTVIRQVQDVEPIYYESVGDGLLAAEFVANRSEVRGSARLAAQFYGKARQALGNGRQAGVEEKLAALEGKAALARAMPEVPREGRVVIVQTTDGDRLDALLQAVQRIENEVAEIKAKLERLEGKQSYRAESEAEPAEGKTVDASGWWKTWWPGR